MELRTFKEIYLSETALSVNELIKYEYRIPLFLQKMEEETPFTTTSGEDVFIKNTDENKKKLQDIQSGELTGKITLDGVDGPVSLGSILKTPEFGGGSKGSGGGAANTALTESAQCVYCAVAQKLGQLNTKEEIEQNYESVKKMFDISVPINDVISKMNDVWVKSSIMIANLILNLSYLKNKKYVFHRGSETVDLINSTFNNVKNTGNIKLSDINKWNPADIWAVNASWDINSAITKAKITSLLELNDFIDKNFNDGNLIGISLKKVVNETPPVKVFNKPDINIFEVKFLGYRITKGDIFTDSKDVYLNANFHGYDTKIQFRSFSNAAGWQGEIKGKAANAGKISGGPLASIIKHFGSTLPEPGSVRSDIKSKSESFAKDFYSLYKKYYKVDHMDFDKFKQLLWKPSNLDYSFSKYMGLKFIDTFNSMTQKDDIVRNIFSYAISATDISSVFIKIGE